MFELRSESDLVAEHGHLVVAPVGDDGREEPRGVLPPPDHAYEYERGHSNDDQEGEGHGEAGDGDALVEDLVEDVAGEALLHDQLARVVRVELVPVLAALLVVDAVPRLVVHREALRTGRQAPREKVIHEALVARQTHRGVPVLAPRAVLRAAHAFGYTVDCLAGRVGLALHEAVVVVSHEQIRRALCAVARVVSPACRALRLALRANPLSLFDGDIRGTWQSSEAGVVESVEFVAGETAGALVDGPLARLALIRAAVARPRHRVVDEVVLRAALPAGAPEEVVA